MPVKTPVKKAVKTPVKKAVKTPVKELASNNNISKDLKLTCKQKNKNKNTCKDLHDDPKYFLRRLQKHDIKLFKYDIDNKNKTMQYSRSCQGSDKQPVVLSYDPSKEKSIKKESFTSFLKHSSNPKEFNRWYICPKYWCPTCEIPIAESDIDKKTITSKIAKCPFGDHQVFVKGKDNYPGFLDASKHPNGLKMPCCFRKKQQSK